MEKIDLFIGHFVDIETKELPRGISFAGNYYQNKIRHILDINHSISIIYGENNKTYKTDEKTTNIFIKKQRYLSNIFYIIKHIAKSFRENKKIATILFYNLNIYTLSFFIYFVFFKKAKVVVLLADAEFLIEDNVVSKLISKTLSYSHGILSLREIPKLRKFKSRIEIMPGIISNSILINETERIPDTVLFSGSLGLTNGLLLALEYFSNQSRFKLIITGVPHLLTDLEFRIILDKYKSESITYLGILNYDDYLNVLNSCEFNLSLRNPNEIGHQYNFPSKILEYMSYGNIVISSLNYPELNDDIYLKTEYSLNGLSKCLNKISNTEISERTRIAVNAQIYVKNNYSEEIFRKKIDNLYK